MLTPGLPSANVAGVWLLPLSMMRVGVAGVGCLLLAYSVDDAGVWLLALSLLRIDVAGAGFTTSRALSGSSTPPTFSALWYVHCFAALFELYNNLLVFLQFSNAEMKLSMMSFFFFFRGVAPFLADRHLSDQKFAKKEEEEDDDDKDDDERYKRKKERKTERKR